MTLTDLARRAVVCRQWRWKPGMLVRYGDQGAWYRLTEGDGYGLPVKYVPPNPRDAWPDLTDPATLGCLLYLVREAHGDVVWLHYDCGVWVVCGLPEDPGGSATEAEALVVALEAAP